MTTTINSPISWSKSLVATPDMTYESLSLLYNETRDDIFGDHMAFAVSCSREFSHPTIDHGIIHKLEVTARPTFSAAKLEITHEVLPGLGASSQIIDVNSRLKVACFDNGSIIPIMNFGIRKTFNSYVRGRLHHHVAPINCLASDSNGTNLASGSADGEIALYQVKGEEISFVSRKRVVDGIITGLAFFKPTEQIGHRPNDNNVFNDENLLIYSTHNGYIGLIDRRCKFGAQIDHSPIHRTEPRLNLSSLCLMRSGLAGQQVVFFGSKHGHLVALDLRSSRNYLHEYKSPQDGCIRRMKEIIVPEKVNDRSFLAYTNGTNQIRILDSSTLIPDPTWVLDRQPEGIQRDLYQVNDRIVTCGDNTSIGCWLWDY